MDIHVDGSQWKPTLKGSSSSGSFVFTSQFGYSLRQGILTTISFDLVWTSSGGASGDLILDLPYRCTLGSGLPFVGGCFTSILTYPGAQTAVTIVADPGSFNGFFQAYGGGTNAINVTAQNVGRVAGTLFYIGVEDE